MNKIIVIGVMLLFLGSSIPTLAKNQSSLSKTISLSSASSAEDYIVYIGAGIFRKHVGGNFGFGWQMEVDDTGNKNITGVFYEKETTLSGKDISNETDPFSLKPDTGFGVGSFSMLRLPPIKIISLTVVVENMTYSKSGYEIGPFVLLVG
jgi:hypothetical protein